MRSKLLAGEMISQCPKCLGVEVLTDVKAKRSNYQSSICDLPSLPKKLCYGCKNHIGELDEMVVDKGVEKTQ